MIQCYPDSDTVPRDVPMPEFFSENGCPLLLELRMTVKLNHGLKDAKRPCRAEGNCRVHDNK